MDVTPIEPSNWLTTSATTAPTNADGSEYLIVYTLADGKDSCADASVMLTQCDRTTGRVRIVMAGLQPETGEVVAAPDWPGFKTLMPRWQWTCRRYIGPVTQPPTKHQGAQQ